MEQIFISEIKINKVRHLKNVIIPLSSEKSKNLIITGKNGSGKTGLLDSIAGFLNSITTSDDLEEARKLLERTKETLKSALERNKVNTK